MWWQLSAPSRVLLDLGPIKIYWYGLFVVAGIVLALVVILKVAAQKKYDLDKVFNLLFYVIIFGLIGARVWEVVGYSWTYFKTEPWAILKIWQGGLAIHGALAGGFLAVVVWAHRNKESVCQYLDLLALSLPLGQAIGRWGNYFNQELFGQPTTSWWGIYIEAINRPDGWVNFSTFQPVFLYESLLSLALFWWLWHKRASGQGAVVGWYLIGYGIIRFVLEFIRLDQVEGLLGLRWPQIISLVMVIVGLIILLPKIKKSATISQFS